MVVFWRSYSATERVPTYEWPHLSRVMGNVYISHLCVLMQGPQPCSVPSAIAHIHRVLQQLAFISRNIFASPTLCQTFASFEISRSSQSKKLCTISCFNCIFFYFFNIVFWHSVIYWLSISKCIWPTNAPLYDQLLLNCSIGDYLKYLALPVSSIHNRLIKTNAEYCNVCLISALFISMLVVKMVFILSFSSFDNSYLIIIHRRSIADWGKCFRQNVCLFMCLWTR